MAVWVAAQIVSTAPGGRVNLPGTSTDFARVLSPKFVQNDGSNYATIGYGVKVIKG